MPFLVQTGSRSTAFGVQKQSSDSETAAVLTFRERSWIGRCQIRGHYSQAHNVSTYSAEPSRSQPSSWAWSLSCCPRRRLITKKPQSTSGKVVISPHSFSNWQTG